MSVTFTVWWLGCAGLAAIGICIIYLYVLSVAGATARAGMRPVHPTHRFAVAIPAHDEEGTIGGTIRQLQQQEYPRELFTIFVVADGCSDHTATESRAAGAVCFERCGQAATGKGDALVWLFDKILSGQSAYDAVVVFDADSLVDSGFLRAMDALLTEGCLVIQGRHVVANPRAGWFPAIMYVAYMLDNRRNQGRSNLDLSCKLMGDAMCFARSVLERVPWRATCETEDAEYWATLALHGERVVFAPHAVSRSQMVTSLRAASHQRARWMAGGASVGRRFAPPLLRCVLRTPDRVRLDALLQLVLPSYSTLLMLAALITVMWAVIGTLSGVGVAWLILTWAGLLTYPLAALVVERAPAEIYLYLACAPWYAVWRSLLRVAVVFRRPTGWVRTPRPR